MGLFDNFIKQIDNGLKAVESGALEERLNTVADKLDAASKRTEATLDKIADKPGDTLQAVEAREKQVEDHLKAVSQQMRRHIDIAQD